MFLSALALAAALQQEKPDRSGEPKLRECLAAVQALKNERLVVLMAERSRKDAAYEPDQTVQIDFGPKGEVRTLGTAVWGSGLLAVKTTGGILVDPLSDESPILLKDSGELPDAVPGLGTRGNFGSPIFMFRRGVDALAKLVAPTSPVTFSQDTFRFRSPDYSSMAVRVDPKTMLPVLIEFDNLDYLKSTGGNFRPAPTDPSTIHQIHYSRLPKSDRTFSIAPPAGRRVEDQRKKKPAGTL